jgi:hypothetical protein
MVRNTRAVVALKLPRRHAVTIRVDGSEGERAAYQELAAAARRFAVEASGRNRLALAALLELLWRSAGQGVMLQLLWDEHRPPKRFSCDYRIIKLEVVLQTKRSQNHSLFQRNGPRA